MNLPRTLIVGIGSSHGDDQAGWQVAQRLANDIRDDQVAVRQAASPDRLLDWLDGVEHLVVCDACRGSGAVGEVKRWRWPLPENERTPWSSTHGLTLPAVLQLIEQLGRLPPHVVIWTVEAGASGAMDTMSPEVEAALPKLVSAIVDDRHSQQTLQDWSCTNNRS